MAGLRFKIPISKVNVIQKTVSFPPITAKTPTFTVSKTMMKSRLGGKPYNLTNVATEVANRQLTSAALNQFENPNLKKFTSAKIRGLENIKRI